jgi:regulator of sigma E protease
MASLPHTLFYFALALVVLIAVHEFGHYWVARKLGVKVLRFSLGFGKVIWRHQKSPVDTEFTLSLLPLGGYVKMVDEREDKVDARDLPFAFNRKPVAARAAIVVAGPLFNLLLAILIYWITFMWGETGSRPLVGKVDPISLAGQAGFVQGDEIESVDDRKTPTWPLAVGAILERLIEDEAVTVAVKTADGNRAERLLSFPNASLENPEQVVSKLGLKPIEVPLPPVIEKTEPGSPAEAAGFLSGDRIEKIEGRPVKDWRDWVADVRSHPGMPLDVTVNRDGVVLHLAITPAAVAPESSGPSEGVLRKLMRRLAGTESPDVAPAVPAIGRVGAQVRIPENVYETLEVKYRLGPWDAFLAACARTFDYATATFKIAGRMLVGRAAVDNLSGPISIAQLAGRSASLGFDHFLRFLALVSISLGVLNLLPIPVLDGGHLLFYGIEALRGRPLDDRTQMRLQQIGMTILMALMMLGLYLDLGRL